MRWGRGAPCPWGGCCRVRGAGAPCCAPAPGGAPSPFPDIGTAAAHQDRRPAVLWGRQHCGAAEAGVQVLAVWGAPDGPQGMGGGQVGPFWGSVEQWGGSTNGAIGATRTDPLLPGVQHGEPGPAGDPHGRVHRGGAQPDPQRHRVLHAAAHGRQGGAAPGHRGRVQHPVCPEPRVGAGERSPLCAPAPSPPGQLSRPN